MRKRDSKHQAQLDIVQRLPASELIRRVGVSDHTNPVYIESEVLATLVRNRFGQADRVLDAAVEELNRRIQVLVGKRMRGVSSLPEVRRRGSEAVQDTIDYIWSHLFEEVVPISNAEVRFAVYVRDRFDDFMRHLRAEKNSMDSIDAMQTKDEDGNATPFIDSVEDGNAETPEDALARKQLSARVVSMLMSLPTAERNAFYFRSEFQYEWRKVAELLGCSIPTARQHHAAALEKLKGVLE